MRGRCVLGTLIVFAAGAVWGLSQAAQAAKAAGCPAAGGAGAKAAGARCGVRLADAAEEVAETLAHLRQRSTDEEPGGKAPE
ncbi:hypothetical protein Strvi_0182 (plasmid) [Streptomyces violaceusniger Tu 4113]|uniref:Secreted protein n=1 Tax=Streptomyces violaceusniger (strain Tu 4113) TaxID=653045 RepID=G2PI04_STRV4|nr:hypothetical protein Strvi_0182 [Streptomyces violaceusniger Tu 4113]